MWSLIMQLALFLSWKNIFTNNINSVSDKLIARANYSENFIEKFHLGNSDQTSEQSLKLGISMSS